MSYKYKTAGQVVPLAATNTVLYTVPADMGFVSSSLIICNRNLTGGGARYRIAVVPNGETLAEKHYVSFDDLVSSRKTEILNMVMTLGSGDQVVVQTDDSNLTFMLFGSETVGTQIELPTLVGFLDVSDGILGKRYNIDVSILFTGAVDGYSIDGVLPVGMVLDSITGVISGYAAQLGVFDFKARAHRVPGGFTATALDTMTIGDGVPNYDPEWLAEKFTHFPKDAGGWSILTPSATSRIMYVSEAGNDATGVIYTSTSFPDIYNPTGEQAFATVAAAHANVRLGEDDWILIKRGNSFIMPASVRMRSGKSATERHVVTSYGDIALPRPVLKSSIASHFDVWKVCSNLAWLGLDFYGYKTDPNSPDFTGFSTPSDPGGIYVYNEGAINSHFLIEDCAFRFCGPGFTGGSVEEMNNFDIVIRRCSITDRYPAAGGGHRQGLYTQGGSVLFEENLTDHNGWWSETNGAATVFNHNNYSSSTNHHSIFRNNISMRPSSMHFKWTSNPPLIDSIDAPTLTTALTGAAETTINVSRINAYTAPSGKIKIALNSTATRTVNYTSWIGTTYTIEATDFTLDNANIGNKIAVDVMQTTDIVMHGNCFIEGQICTSIGGNDRNYLGHRFRDIVFADNVALHVGKYEKGATFNIGWGVEIVDVKNLLIENNYFAHTDRATADTYMVLFTSGSYIENATVENNHGYLINNGGIETSPLDTRHVNNIVRSNAISFNASRYHEPSRNLASYCAKLGITQTVDAFSAECRLQRKGYWRPEYTAKAINDYIKEGFTLNTAVPFIIMNPSPLLPNEPAAVLLNTDAVGVGGVTFQWYKNDVIIPGETGSSYAIPVTVAGTNDVYKCQITDINGNVVTSLAPVVVDPPLTRPLLTGNGASYCTATGLTLNNNEGFGFTFKATKASVFFSSTGATHSISLTSNTNLNVRVFSTQFNFTLPAVDFSHKHTVKFKRTAGVPVLIFDGVAYPERSGLVFSSAGSVNVVGGGASGATPVPVSAATALQLWDVTVYDAADAVKLKYDINSGGVDLETEAASVGAGTLTFKGVLAGDWVNLP